MLLKKVNDTVILRKGMEAVVDYNMATGTWLGFIQNLRPDP
jgi:hypothetical protein